MKPERFIQTAGRGVIWQGVESDDFGLPLFCHSPRFLQQAPADTRPVPVRVGSEQVDHCHTLRGYCPVCFFVSLVFSVRDNDSSDDPLFLLFRHGCDKETGSVDGSLEITEKRINAFRPGGADRTVSHFVDEVVIKTENRPGIVCVSDDHFDCSLSGSHQVKPKERH